MKCETHTDKRRGNALHPSFCNHVVMKNKVKGNDGRFSFPAGVEKE